MLVETSCGLEDSNANLNPSKDKIEQFAHESAQWFKNHCNVSLLSVSKLRMWFVFLFYKIKCC